MGCGFFSLIFLVKGRWDRGQLTQINIPAARINIEPTRKTTPKPDLRQKQLLEAIKNIVATTSGQYAIAVYHLDEGTEYGFNQKIQMPAASLMKLPVFLTVLDKIKKGDLEFEDKYTMEEADRAAGSGPLQFKTAGSSYTVDELLTYLGKNSDNTAWVMFNRRLGMMTMEQTMKNIGMTSSNYREVTTTAEDTVKIWKYIYNFDYGREKLWGYLTGSIYEDRMPVGIFDDEVEIIHKVGTDAGVWADAGIIKCSILNTQCSFKPFILVILNDGVKRAEAEGVVPEIARKIWEYERQGIN